MNLLFEIGKTFLDYRVIEPLGDGHFSKVYLVWNTNHQRFEALKAYTRARHQYVYDKEVAILKKISGGGNINIVTMYETFSYSGYPCITMELLQGDLLTYIENRTDRDINTSKRIIHQLFAILDVLEASNILHMDIKPENIGIGLSSEESFNKGITAWNKQDKILGPCPMQRVYLQEKPFIIKLLDFGNSLDLDVDTPCITYNHVTKEYRPYEVIVGRAPFTLKIDTWSMACVIFELLTEGDYLFDPGKGVDDHVALIIELLGEEYFPVDFKLQGKYAKHIFKTNGALKQVKHLNYCNLAEVLKEKSRFSAEERQHISELLLPMLHPDYALRKKVITSWLSTAN